MQAQSLARRFAIVAGSMILAVAAIHLAMTARLLEGAFGPAVDGAGISARSLFLVSWVVSGLLFVPLGLTTLYSARGMRSGDSWGFVLAMGSGLVAVALALVLSVVLPGGALATLPVLAVIFLLAGGGLALIGVLVWARRDLLRS